ncbi:kelch-like protein 7 isoform 1 [Camelus ferus]|nr:kelch-like protein 7 isoform 1 [Camelus ferus]
MAASGVEKSSKKKTEKKLAAREEAKLLAGFMGVMNNMRKQKALMIFTFIVQGFQAQLENISLLGSPLPANMLESKSFEVELKDAEPDIIEQLVEFAYTARISVNSNNVQSLLDAANQYQIEPVKKMCVDFLKEQVDASNCLGISVLAECLDCPELKATADDFIHQHFTEVYKTDEFLQLDVKRVTHLLNQDTLTVRAEDQVYDAAVRWLKYDEPNRQPFMVDILAKVRFPLISKNFLSKTVQAEPLIQDNPECLKMVISGMRYHLLSPEDREELVEGTRPRRKKHDYRIALFGGSQPQSCRYFNPKDYSWTDIRCPFEKRRDAACVFWDNVVYILGGSQLFPIKRMDCYNVVKDSWYSKLGPPTPRDSLAACAAEGKIYTSGGSEVGNSALYLFECYDTRTESWHTKPSMLTQRCSHGMVEANGLIYVCGGSLGNNVSGRVLNSCEVYDPATETWTELCPMIEARKNHGLVFVKDKIFAVGGQNSLGGLDNVEYYDIKLNEWKMVSPMPWKGVTVKCAAVGSIVYVLAGFQGVGRLGHILEYNTETDKWVANSKVRAFPDLAEVVGLADQLSSRFGPQAFLEVRGPAQRFKEPLPPRNRSSIPPSQATLSAVPNEDRSVRDVVAMTICQFFLQGRCRFGDRCWNEHPRAGGAGGGRQQQQQPSGSNRRGWNNTSQRYSNVIQPSSFSKSAPWRGSRDQEKPSFGSFDSGASTSRNRGFGLSQNPFASPSSDEQKDEKKLLEGIVKDMEVWESSGQWMFSAYSPVKKKPNISAKFHPTVNKSMEEQGFPMNNNSSDNAQNFSFKPSSGFATALAGSPSVFGSAPAFGAAPSASSAITTSAPTFGRGKPEITSAASFSFKSPAASGFGSSGFSGLPASMAAGPVGAPVAPAFGSGSSVAGFGSPGSHSLTAFSKSSGDTFGNSSISTSLPVSNGSTTTDNVLFTPKDQLTAEELEQFQSKKFTLGKIPLKPPPVELLNI